MDSLNTVCTSIKNKTNSVLIAAYISVQTKIRSRDGQGTTEYAILVGVLVVVAIMAITLFKPKIEELWNSIAIGINGL